MNEYDTLALARDLGVKLGVDTKQEPLQILARPKEKITDELREALRDKANRDVLIRGLLFKSALRWLGECNAWGKLYGPEYEQLQVVEHDTLEEYREALRAWAKAGLEKGKAA